MRDPTHLDWPFFGDVHRALARELGAWVTQEIPEDDEPAPERTTPEPDSPRRTPEPEPEEVLS